MFGRTRVEVQEDHRSHDFFFSLWKGCSLVDSGVKLPTPQAAAEAGVKAQADYKQRQELLKADFKEARKIIKEGRYV